LGTGGAIKNTLNSLPEFFFVMYGDSYLRVDYKKIETYFNKNKNSSKNNLMTIINNKNRWDKSNVVYKGNKILSYSKGKASEGKNYIDYGLSIFSNETFNKINKNIKFNLSDYLSFLAKKELLLSYEIRNRFYEVGSLKGINDLNKILK
jgi:NDP-sugar pyrophosphorylase family protein